MKSLNNLLFTKYLNYDEEIVSITHNHPCSITNIVGADLLIWFAGPAFLIYADLFMPYGYYLFPLGILIMMYHLYDWYGDALILTNKGVINVEWNGILNQKSQRANLSDVSTVYVNKQGIGPLIFNYGELNLNCSNGSVIKIKYAKNPEKSQGEILKQREIVEMNIEKSDNIDLHEFSHAFTAMQKRKKPTQAEKKGFVQYQVSEEEVE